MTYSEAAQRAQMAAAYAGTAKSNYTEYADQQLAEAVTALAWAVAEIAKGLDSRPS